MGNSILAFEGHNVEVFELNGQVLFNPKDVATCLEIADVNSSIRNFNEKQVVKVKNSDMHNLHIRKLNNAGERFLTESGVYKLVFKSKKPNAEEFVNWVTDEVLPQIRKTGGYIPTQSVNALPMTDDQIMAQAVIIAQKTIELRNQEIAAMKTDIAQKECELVQANGKIEELEPKGEYYDNILQSDMGVSISSIADDFGLSAITMNKLLKEWGIQYKRGDRWYLHAKYKGLGYVVSDTYSGNHKDGTPAAFQHMKWTQLGRKFIYGEMKAHNYETLAEQAENILNAASGGV